MTDDMTMSKDNAFQDMALNNIADNSVVCLMAPTASGKTALAYELYDSGRYEIVSVDSALIYRDMNIGTAKPTAEELERYPHHLVDIIDPTQSYSVAEFVRDVEQLVHQIYGRGKIPLLVGGTMMYYMALFEGLSNVPESEASVREEVEAWRQAEGIETLHRYLREIDPAAYARLKPTDTQRITRAIEVYKQTGRALSEWQAQPKNALAQNSDTQWYGLAVMPDRQWLHERIDRRLDIMWQQGLIEEVIGLLESYPLTPNMAAMRCVGYRQVLEYLVAISHPVLSCAHLDTEAFYQTFMAADNQAKLATVSPLNHHSDAYKLACLTMRNKALYATRQLAKRQYTWLRKITKPPHDFSSHVASDQYAATVPIFYTFNNIQAIKPYLE